jgi:hypothetical protein
MKREKITIDNPSDYVLVSILPNDFGNYFIDKYIIHNSFYEFLMNSEKTSWYSGEERIDLNYNYGYIEVTVDKNDIKVISKNPEDIKKLENDIIGYSDFDYIFNEFEVSEDDKNKMAYCVDEGAKFRISNSGRKCLLENVIDSEYFQEE